MTDSFETIATRPDGRVLCATFSAPPINLIGPEVVRDLGLPLERLARHLAPRRPMSSAAAPTACSAAEYRPCSAAPAP
jgi:hypothetical protein